MRDHRGIIFASLYTIIKNKMGDIFLSGQNQCHITGVKKSYFCHTFHLRPKKVFWWVGGGWKVTLVSVCVHFLKLLDTQTQILNHGAVSDLTAIKLSSSSIVFNRRIFLILRLLRYPNQVIQDCWFVSELNYFWKISWTNRFK